MVQQIYLACAVLTLCVTVSSYYSPHDLFIQPEKRNIQKYCGNEINEALKMICHSVYNTMFAKKRSNLDRAPLPSDGDYLDGHELAENRFHHPNTMFRENFFHPLSDLDSFVATIQHLRYPFASKASSLTMLPPQTSNFIRRKRGVYDECCKKSCSLNELASYCGSN